MIAFWIGFAAGVVACPFILFAYFTAEDAWLVRRWRRRAMRERSWRRP